jgi:dephospho-CoA kinase
MIEAEAENKTDILLVEGALLGVSDYMDYALFDGVIWLSASDKTRKQRLRKAGRAGHLQRRLPSPKYGRIIRVDAEGTIEQTANLVLKAISRIPCSEKRS